MSGSPICEPRAVTWDAFIRDRTVQFASGGPVGITYRCAGPGRIRIPLRRELRVEVFAHVDRARKCVSPESEPANIKPTESPGVLNWLRSLTWSPSIVPNMSRTEKSPLCEPESGCPPARGTTCAGSCC